MGALVQARYRKDTRFPLPIDLSFGGKVLQEKTLTFPILKTDPGTVRVLDRRPPKKKKEV